MLTKQKWEGKRDRKTLRAGEGQDILVHKPNWKAVSLFEVINIKLKKEKIEWVLSWLR